MFWNVTRGFWWWSLWKACVFEWQKKFINVKNDEWCGRTEPAWTEEVQKID